MKPEPQTTNGSFFMTLYRVHHHTDNGTSYGYSWHLCKRDAQKAVDKSPATTSDEDAPELEVVELRVSTQGLLSFAIKYASHPDNG